MLSNEAQKKRESGTMESLNRKESPLKRLKLSSSSSSFSTQLLLLNYIYPIQSTIMPHHQSLLILHSLSTPIKTNPLSKTKAANYWYLPAPFSPSILFSSM